MGFGSEFPHRLADSIYDVFDTPTTWPEAAHQCASMGGQLAKITSSVEHTFVRSLLSDPTGDSVWIGLNDIDTETSFVWADGEASSAVAGLIFTADNFLGSDCVASVSATEVQDFLCTELRQYVCERPVHRDFKDQFYARGSIYHISSSEETLNQTAAAQVCESKGSHLVFINSAAENSFLVSHIGTSSQFWIGYNGAPATPVWSDGSAIVFENFDQAQTHDCAVLKTGSSAWRTLVCSDVKRYICERPLAGIYIARYRGF